MDELICNSLADHLLQHMPVAAFVLDAEHRVVIWNRECEHLTGSAREIAANKRAEAATLRQSVWAAFESALFTTSEGPAA